VVKVVAGLMEATDQEFEKYGLKHLTASVAQLSPDDYPTVMQILDPNHAIPTYTLLSKSSW
jgi:hypothetical protein